jgi:hypothetical protein
MPTPNEVDFNKRKVFGTLNPPLSPLFAIMALDD